MYNEEKIDQYLSNRLSEGERSNFEAEIAANEDLRKEVALQKMLAAGITAGGNRRLKARLQAMHDEATEEDEKSATKVVQMRPRRWLAIAASVAIMAMAVWWIMAQPADNQALFADYYEPYTTNLTTRDMSSDDILAQIETLYNAGKYEEAIPVIETALSQNPANAKLSLAAGVAHLELNNLEKAAFYFKRAAANELLQEVADWYLALTYLKQDRVEETKQLLEKIKETASPHYQAKATDLLEKL